MWQKNIDWYAKLIEIGARKEGRVWRMASGKYSDVEYDLWQLYKNANLYSHACHALLKKAEKTILDSSTYFVGLERDGIALALELARQTGASAAFATKTPFGAKLAEFCIPPGSRAILVVDVHTAGTAFVKTRIALEGIASVEDPVLALVNRSGSDHICLWPNATPQGYMHDRRIVSLVGTNEPGWALKDCPPHILRQIHT